MKPAPAKFLLADSRAAWTTAIAAAILTVSGVNAPGQAFSPGNLVVVQGGDGVQSLSGSGNEIFLDQFTPSGTLVSSLALPTNGPSAFIQNISSITEGFVNLTPNGQELVLAGYNVSYGFTNNTISSDSAAGIPRAVCTVDVNGNYSLVTNSTTLFSAANIRSAASDGNFNFWAEGSSGGMGYMGTGTQTAITGTVLNSRVIQIIGGNLYYSTGSDKRGIIMVNGTPTSGAATTNYIIPTGTFFNSTAPSPYAFVFDPGMTVCYVADSNNYTNSTTIGGVEKWTNNGSGTFVFAYTLQPGPAGNPSGTVGLAASFGSTTNLYGTLANGTNLFAIADTGPASVGAVIYSCAANQVLRGVRFAPTNGVTPVAPAITAIHPTSQTVTIGGTAAFTVLAKPGVPAANNFWYFVANSKTNLIPGATGTTLTVTNLQTTNTGSYFVVLTNPSGSVTSKLASLNVILPQPAITGISPTSATVNAGQSATFTLTGSFGSPPASNFWYVVTPTATNLIPGQTGTTLTLTDVLTANTAGYFAILTNIFGASTSSIATLDVVNDPNIQVEPSSAQGVVNGTVQFTVTAAATAPGYQWYFADSSGNIVAPAVSPGDGSIISGATSSTLTFANLQPGDLTNFVVVVTNIYGAVTSTVASLLTGTNNAGMLPYNQGVLALWDFDGSQFTNFGVNPNCVYFPQPFIGNGTAEPVGSAYNPAPVLSLANLTSTSTSPFATGATDPNDVGLDPNTGSYVFTPFGFEQPSPNGTLGTANYPAFTGTNKQNGMQFNVSTLGARNIHISYDARVSSTASDYHRLQYTTNGTTWIDFPASASFDGLAGGSTYYIFKYNLAGFPGVDNNPNFGFRIVTEWQSTATYQTPGPVAANTNSIGVNGLVATNFWVGTANSYTSGASATASAGTFSFDLVAVLGDAITNNDSPPTLSSFAGMPVTNGLSFTNIVDTTNLVLNFSASSSEMPATNLTFTVQPVNTVSAGLFSQTVDPNVSIANTGSTNFQLTISFPSPIPDSIDAAPILVTATDTNGQSAATWFLLTALSANLPPTNTLTAVHATNTLANTPLIIPFIANGSMDGTTNLSFEITCNNNTVIPVGNIVVSGGAGGHYTLTITPAANQVGNALITVNAIDSNPLQTRNTSASLAFVVRPNTNIIAADYFNYDQSGPLDTVAAGYWTHLSGINQQMQVSGANGFPPNVATISDGNTENLQAQLVNSPYKTNSGAVLYASYTVNIASISDLPTGNGSYITAFNDGSGNTANVEDCLVVATNGAASGFYRVGVGNAVGATALSAQMFPQDLAPGSNYVVITALSLDNGFSTLWVNPTNQASFSVTDTTPPANPTNLYNIVEFELRESGSVEGVVNVGSFLSGLSFDSVFYPAQANPDSFGVTENTTNVFSPLLNDAGWSPGIVNVTPDGNETVKITGTNITFIPTNNFIGTAVVAYTIQDNLGNTSSSIITVTVTNNPPLANPDSFTVAPNSVNNVLSPLVNDVVQTPGGTLSLVSVGPTNGTASISGTNVLFTPTSGFTGTATIGYTITDNIGGTNSSLITVTVGTVTPIPLNTLTLNKSNIVLSWTNSAFSLQRATNVAGPYVTIPGASSPYTNLTTTNGAGFFRLMQ